MSQSLPPRPLVLLCLVPPPRRPLDDPCGQPATAAPTGDSDPATGLLYYRARCYDPVCGRWLSDDPVAFAAGDSNCYRYVRRD
jgi:hypothetical protein